MCFMLIRWSHDHGGHLGFLKNITSFLLKIYKNIMAAFNFRDEVFSLLVINVISHAPCPSPRDSINILATIISMFEKE